MEKLIELHENMNELSGKAKTEKERDYYEAVMFGVQQSMNTVDLRASSEYFSNADDLNGWK